VWTFVAFAAAGNLLWGAWSALGPVVAARELGGAAVWGAVLAAMGVGALVGGVVAIRAEPRRPLMVSAALSVALALALALLAASAPPVMIALGAFLAGLGLMLGSSLWESTLQRHIPPESLSRVSAYDWFGSLAFQPLGLAVWGPVGAWVGISTALLTAAVPMAALTAVVIAVPDIRRLEGVSRPSAAPGGGLPAAGPRPSPGTPGRSRS